MSNTINCPHCNTEINVEEALSHKLEQDIKLKNTKDLAKKQQELDKALSGIKNREDAVEKAIESQVLERVQSERSKLHTSIKKQVESEQSEAMELLKNELKEKSEVTKNYNKAQTQIIQLKREKEEANSLAELKAEKQLDEKLRAAVSQVQKESDDKINTINKENEVKISQMKKNLENAQRQASQGSQQVQGEAQELIIKDWLASQFPVDNIEGIKKGAKGGDCLQHIIDNNNTCGTIYYESKKTQAWQKGWVEKLKKDMLAKGADIGVIVTKTMPKELDRMGNLEGIVVCPVDEWKILPFFLRQQLIEVYTVRRAGENKSDKMSMLYNYLTGNEFKMQIEAIVSGFKQMQKDLDSEKTSMNRIWSQRAKQIDKVITSTSSMYGSLQGISDNAIGHIKALELPYTEKKSQ
jgi:hypothetical protein